MNRRTFISTLSAVSALAVLPMTGCSLKSTAQAVLNTMIAVYNADPNAAWSPDLEIAIQDATTAIADWNGSSVNCELQSALQIGAAILDSIPLGLTIDLIVTIALAGLNALLAEIAPCSTAALARKLSREYSGHLHSGTPVYKMYYSQFKADAKWRLGADITSAFNKAANSAGLSQVVAK